MPEAAIRIRTSPAPGRGSGISPTTKTSRACPCFSYQAALIEKPSSSDNFSSRTIAGLTRPGQYIHNPPDQAGRRILQASDRIPGADGRAGSGAATHGIRAKIRKVDFPGDLAVVAFGPALPARPRFRSSGPPSRQAPRRSHRLDHRVESEFEFTPRAPYRNGSQVTAAPSISRLRNKRLKPLKRAPWPPTTRP